jgi:hypothetical protein
MKLTQSNSTHLEKAGSTCGTVMMLAWTFVVGIFGFGLLFGVYVAMITQNRSLLFLCCLGLALPILLTAVFGLLTLAEVAIQKINVGGRSFESRGAGTKRKFSGA